MSRPIRDRDEICRAPFEGDQAHVSMAHSALTEEVDAMLYNRSQSSLGMKFGVLPLCSLFNSF
jgi:hypothetical protein